MGEESYKDAKLEMYGGNLGASVPLIIAVIGFVIFSVYERGAITAFWVSCWLGIGLGIFLAKNRRRYAESVFEGISRREGAAIYVVWIFAGVLGQVWRGGGLVEGMVWFGSSSGAVGPWFVIVTYFAAIVLATGLGTSVGTVVSLAPVMYPAGIALGADPVALALALIAGGAFGDNLGPISDTTIVSSVSQDAEIGDVVRSRFPLSAVAAIIAGIALFGLALAGSAQPTGTYEIKGESPVPYLIDAIKKLEASGAEFIAIACNLAHYYYEELVKGASVPILHIVRETVRFIADNYQVKKVGVLAPTPTIKVGLYQDELKRAGYEVITLDEKQTEDLIDKAIYSEKGIKAGFIKENVEAVLKAIKTLFEEGAEVTILACTELPLVAEYFEEELKNKIIDPTDVLAKRIVTLSKSPR